MGTYKLEICVDSVESALAAAENGADRLELCSNLMIGGTTPSEALFEQIRKYADIRTHILIRPRSGDFCYSEYEFDVIKEEVKRYKAAGAEGIVIGILKKDGTLDADRIEKLICAADGMSVTLHRAFDVCRDPFEAMETACALGMDAILTSGQGNTCMEGLELLKELVIRADHRIEIMAGSGVGASVIPRIAEYTGVKSFHMSGKRVKDSEMIYRKQGVFMGTDAISEYEIWCTDGEKVREARQIMDRLER